MPGYSGFFEGGGEGGGAGGGLTEGQHELLDTLTHDISETSFLEALRNVAGRIIQITYWESAARLTKIRETILMRNSLQRVTQETTTQYDGSGLPVVTLTTNFTRINGRIASATLTEV